MENEDRLKDAEQGDSKVGGGLGVRGIEQKGKGLMDMDNSCWLLGLREV